MDASFFLLHDESRSSRRYLFEVTDELLEQLNSEIHNIKQNLLFATIGEEDDDIILMRRMLKPVISVLDKRYDDIATYKCFKDQYCLLKLVEEVTEYKEAVRGLVKVVPNQSNSVFDCEIFALVVEYFQILDMIYLFAESGCDPSYPKHVNTKMLNFVADVLPISFARFINIFRFHRSIYVLRAMRQGLEYCVDRINSKNMPVTFFRKYFINSLFELVTKESFRVLGYEGGKWDARKFVTRHYTSRLIDDIILEL